MSHSDLLERAKQAINDLFSDQTVSRLATVECLEELGDEINVMLSALAEDVEREAAAIDEEG